MDDELNIDPRETDYFDDYDMNQAINFYELKTQLADLGFVAPAIVDSLRSRIMSGTRDFRLAYQEQLGALKLNYSFDIRRNDPDGPLQLDHLDAAIYRQESAPHFYAIFSPDISKVQVHQVLQKGLDGPFITAELPDYFDQHKVFNFLNPNIMNTQNLAYLQKQLLNLGFGESLNQELEKQIAAKTPEFTLDTRNTYNKQEVDYKLHYKAGDLNEMYFFNKYDARTADKQQTFYLNQGQGITAKEAFNLLEGRAVYKHLENLEKQPYNAWLVLDQQEHKLKPYTDGWNYKPEKAIDKMAIVGIDEPGARDKLMASLQKGNRHQVTAMKNGKEVQLYIEANPAEHRVNLTNYKSEAQRLEDYKKPEFKTEQKKDQKQAQAQEAAPEKSNRANAALK